jgi:glycosyltransferase involved in cell wall biosynthesis
MRVYVFPADVAGCGHQRLIRPAETLRALGHDVSVFKPGEQDHFPITIFERGMMRSLTLDIDEFDADVVVIQRPLDWKWQYVIPKLKAMGVKVIADLDDDLTAIRVGHAMWGTVDPINNRDQNWNHLKKAMLQADTVTVSTPALAKRFGRSGSTIVIPNCVPESYLNVTADRSDRLVVGWTGSVATHPHDLNVLGPSLPEVARTVPFEWRVVGSGYGIRSVTGMEPSVVSYVPIDEYIHEVARFDVGVVPLALHPFNEAKSWLKGLEMSSVGVPFVASATSPYLELVAHGAGMIADRPKHWSAMLRRLLTDEPFRADMSAAGREVARLWTFEANAWRWEEAWLGNRQRP